MIADFINSVFFVQFGHSLQQLLTMIPYSEVAGQRYVEWDSLHTCANVMSMLLLRRHTLASLGRHHQTNEPLPDELITNILKGCLLAVDCDLCYVTEQSRTGFIGIWQPEAGLNKHTVKIRI